MQSILVIFGSNNITFSEVLCCQTLTRKVVTDKSFANPEHPLPNKSSNLFHCLRMQYQTMTWMSAASKMNPISWGWKLDDDELVSKMCDMNFASDILLKIIHWCRYKMTVVTIPVSEQYNGSHCSFRTSGFYVILYMISGGLNF